MTGEELKILRTNNDLTQKELAEKIGVTFKTINSYENSGTIPEAKALLFKAMLENGKNKTKSYSVKDTDISQVEGEVDYSNKNFVPFYPVDFIAGDLEGLNDQSIQPEYYMYMPQFNGCTSFLSYNDSMEPLIKSGMMLFAKKVIDWKSHLEYGQIYGIVASDGRKYLKYIRKHQAKSKTHFIFKSENKECYDDFDFPHKKISSIWLIHGYITQRVPA